MQLSRGAGPGDLLEKRQELLTPVPGPVGCWDVARGDLQGRKQGRGPVPDVVVGARRLLPGLHRQTWCRALNGLNFGLLVHAEHDRVLGWGRVEPDYIDHLREQLGVGGEFGGSLPPRNDPVLKLGLGHRDVVDAQSVRQQPGGPVGDAELPQRRTEGDGHDCPVVEPPRPARPVVVGQPRDAGRVVAGPSGDHRGAGGPHTLSDCGVRGSVGGQPHDPCSLCQSGPR